MERLREQCKIFWDATTGGPGDNTNTADVARKRIAKLIYPEIHVEVVAANKRAAEAVEQRNAAIKQADESGIKADLRKHSREWLTAIVGIVMGILGTVVALHH